MSSTSEISEKELVVGNAALEEGVKVRNSHRIEWVVGRGHSPIILKDSQLLVLLFHPVLRVCLLSPNRTNREAELGSIHGRKPCSAKTVGRSGTRGLSEY